MLLVQKPPVGVPVRLIVDAGATMKVVPLITGSGITLIVALPDIVLVQYELLPRTVYVPAVVRFPKEMAPPVPHMGPAANVAPL